MDALSHFLLVVGRALPLECRRQQGGQLACCVPISAFTMMTTPIFQTESAMAVFLTLGAVAVEKESRGLLAEGALLDREQGTKRHLLRTWT